jgi:hypothetical protein
VVFAGPEKYPIIFAALSGQLCNFLKGTKNCFSALQFLLTMSKPLAQKGEPGIGLLNGVCNEVRARK